ncbi:MAG: DUF21 domain-containing protein [Candidatus Krumholzibacteriota bacterium]|nr:DUF21 domain-containing protein [Candidatus Krumholzibacteriota bacterium]
MNGWLAALLLAVLGSAYFAGSETAVVSSDRLRQRAERERGKRLARLAERLYLRPAHTLAALLLGNNVCCVLASISGLMLTERALVAGGLALPDFWTGLVSSLWVSSLLLVFGEALPKSVGHHYAERLTRATAPVLLPLVLALRPLLGLVDLSARGLRRLLTGRPVPGQPLVGWETVAMHLDAGLAQGVVAADEDSLIRRIALLNRIDAGQLVTPLEQLVLHPVGGDLQELRERLAAARAPRAFLYEGEPGNLVGVIGSHRLLGPDPKLRLAEQVRSLRRVPAHRPILELIDELQGSNLKFAAVRDRGGRTLGVVFLEELLRQLVTFRQDED